MLAKIQYDWSLLRIQPRALLHILDPYQPSVTVLLHTAIEVVNSPSYLTASFLNEMDAS